MLLTKKQRNKERKKEIARKQYPTGGGVMTVMHGPIDYYDTSFRWRQALCG